MRKFGLGMLGMAALALFALTATAATPEVDQLIDKMASGKFREREAASKELEKIGMPALDALRKAAQSEDADLSQRAKDIIKAIEKRADADEILQPTLVKLNYKDTPITKICQELSQKTCYPILLQGDAKKLEARLVSIDTKEVSFWEAIDLLCAKAEMSHQTQAGGFGPGGTPSGPPELDRDVPNDDRRGPGTGAPRLPNPGGNPNQIVLIDAKPTAFPTAYCGAIRVRAVPAANFQGGVPLEKEEALLAFEVVAEPKLQVLSMTVRLEKAVDEKNQKVEPMAMDAGRNGEQGTDGVVIVNGNQVIIKGNAVIRGNNIQIGGNFKDIALPAPGRGFGRQIVTAKLKLPANGGKSVKEMQGVLVMQVMGQSRIAVDDLANASGKSFKSKDGREIKIVSVKKLDNGQTQIQVEMDGQQVGADGLIPAIPGNPGRIRIQGNFIPQMNNALPQAFNMAADVIEVPAAPAPADQVEPAEVPPPAGGPAPPSTMPGRPGNYGPEQIQAWTKDGKPCGEVGRSVGVANNGGKVVTIYKLTFQAPEKAEIEKLVFGVPKQTTIELPFELKDIPVK